MRVSCIVIIALTSFIICGTHSAFVYPVIVEARQGSEGRNMLAITSSHILRMEPVSIFEETLRMKIKVSGSDKDIAFDASVLQQNMFQCTKNKATYTVYFSKAGLFVQGIVNTTHAIKPTRQTEGNALGVPHQLFSILPKLNSTSARKRKDLLKWRHKRLKNAGRKLLHRSTKAIAQERDANSRNRPFPIETQLIVDTVLRSSFVYVVDLAQYLGILMNVVNLKLGTLKRHKISVKVVGVTILADEEEEQQVLDLNEEYVDAVPTLEKMEKYAVKELKLEKADVILFITGRPLAKLTGSSRIDLAGETHIKGLCNPPKHVAVVKDVGTVYQASNTIAHELGHLLGAYHDDFRHPKYRDCPLEGHIMAPFIYARQADSYSWCSEQSITDFFEEMTEEQYLDCVSIMNKKTLLTPENHLVPMDLTADEFCKRVKVDPKVSGIIKDCAISCYRGPVSPLNDVGTYPAPYGFQCEPGKVCYLGKCVPCKEIGDMEPWDNCKNT